MHARIMRTRKEDARARGEPVRQIAEREGVSARGVLRVTKTSYSFLSPPPPSAFAERDAKLRAVAAKLDRPALKTWSAAHDAIIAATEAIQTARPYPARARP